MANESPPTDAPNLREEFLKLLDEQHVEQIYQSSMEQNTKLIPREFVQNHGVHFGLILRKLAFGADYKSDFFFVSKSSDNWRLVFTEIEKPQSRFFRDNSNDYHPDFQKALQQIGRWRAWLSQEANLAALLTALGPLRLPLTMRRNPSIPKFVLVHGRRNEYHASDLRRSIVRAEERDDFHILSFDSLVEGLEYKHECYVGARRNETVEIFGDRVLSSELFGWIEPSEFKVSAALREAIRRGNPQGPMVRRFDDGRLVDAMTWVADRICT
jgi:hypothetical protein